MTKHKNRHSPGKTMALMTLGLLGLGLAIAMLLQGTDIRLFNPKGVIAEQQFKLLVFSVLLLLTVVVPTLILLYAFAWKYRETNDKTLYDPDTRHGKFFVFTLWAVPSVFMLLLAFVMWPATQKLSPRNAIAYETKPLTVQVVAMRWKWLFIYPEQRIATVNYVQIPVGRPVVFELTADEAPMSSFWIPHLGGQLYAMTGHVTRLNLLATEPGDYPGSTPEINGKGFTGMKFTARAGSEQEFDAWVKNVRSSDVSLDSSEYDRLVAPSENNPAVFYSSADTDLYGKLLTKYTGKPDTKKSNKGGNGRQ